MITRTQIIAAVIVQVALLALAVLVMLAPLDVEPRQPGTFPQPIPVPCPTGGARC